MTSGPVVVWDHGPFKTGEEGNPVAQLREGRFAFVLNGKKLKERFALARLARGSGKEWLLMKTKDAHADPKWTLKSDLTPQRLNKLAVKVPPCETS